MSFKIEAPWEYRKRGETVHQEGCVWRTDVWPTVEDYEGGFMHDQDQVSYNKLINYANFFSMYSSHQKCSPPPGLQDATAKQNKLDFLF